MLTILFPFSLTGLSSVQCTYGLQPPLFPILKEEVSVPSALALICRFSCLKGDKPSSCKLPRSMRVHPTFHVAQVKPVKESSCSRRHINCHLVYTVRQLLVVWRPGHECQYLVDWEGYDPEERSWVPASNIVDPDLMCRP